ncbi:uncharacterized protein K02A2.6-like [Aedes albopictus]|uniref:RNA-directed DNA polymerase n=1 Tax=Aedes albopictus TaxID=7160 RepID=A0ABM1Z0D3_AEDAL
MSQNNGNPDGDQAGFSGGGEEDVSAVSMSEVMRQMAIQNNRLMALLEQVTGGTQPAQRSAPEHIIESLSSSIKEFHFDPENGLTFDRWFSKYEDLFRQDGRNLDDPAKLSKNEADDFVTYAGIVNRQCEEFELQKLSVNQFKSLVFICGLKSAKDTDVRTRLLSKLESDTADTNIEGLVTECQRLSNLKHDTALVEKKHSSSAVQAVRQFKKQGQKQSNATIPDGNGKLPPSPCWQCGAMHFVKDCQFSKHMCKQCGRMGHKEGYCNCSSKASASTSTVDKKISKKDKKLQMKTIQSVKHIRSRRRYVTVIFNGIEAELQLDCGSDITLISKETWEKIGKPAIKSTRMEATTASGEPLELLGEFATTVSISDVSLKQHCYITSVEGLNVIGLDWMDAFDLWSKPLAAHCKRVNLTKFPHDDQHFVTRFPEVFQDGLGHCTKTKISLTLRPDVQPIFRPKRPVPFHATQKVEEELDRLQSLNIITPIDFSDWAAPIVVVKKPGGKVRICADYSTGLNEALEANHYPLPTPEDIFTKLAGKRVFSIIDLSDAYLQVEVDDVSKKLLTINTHRGLYRFNRLAPGVKSAPGAFQQLMAKMIADLEGVDAFLDDFIVHSEDEENHYRILTALFKRLREYGFRLRLEKCKFNQEEIKYLGLIVNENGIRPDPTKIEAIVHMPAPTNVSTLRSFLGAVNFDGKFVREMHQLRHPLDNLLKKDAKFIWSKECQQAFADIKRILQSNLLLTHYNPELDIIVAGDACKTGIGAVLMHRFPDGSIKAVSHASKSLNQTEQNYSQIEKEALALVFACTKFHRMLWGRRFTLQTDHQPLLKIFGSKKGIPVHTANRLQRWALTLLGYDFGIEYVSTQNFGYADVLSRLINNHEKPEEEAVIAMVHIEADVTSGLQDTLSNLPVTSKVVRDATSKDPVLQKVTSYIKNGWPLRAEAICEAEVKPFYTHRESYSMVGDCVMMMDRVVVPKCLQKRILKRIHQGHPGIERSKAIARGIVFWPRIDSEIADYVRRCSSCASAAKSPPQAKPQPWPRANGPWQRLHLDFAGPLEGYHYLVVVDSYSKWPEILQTRSPTSSTTISFLRECFARFGIPTVVVTDNGSQFVSAEFRTFCEELGVVHLRTAPYHPQSNGQAERFVDTLKRSLRKIIGGGETSTSTALQTFLHIYRSTPSAVLDGESPDERMLGRSMRTTLDLLRPTSQSVGLKPKLNREFEAGSFVYAKVYSSKDLWKWMPGVVLERIGNVNYYILLDHQIGRRKVLRSHIDQLKNRSNDEPVVSKEPMPLSILMQDFGLQRQAVPEQHYRMLIGENPACAVPVQQATETVQQQELPGPIMHAEVSAEDSNSDADEEPDETLLADFQERPSSSSTPRQQQVESGQRPLRTVRPPRRFEQYIRY